MTGRDVLLEIVTENLPARLCPGAAEQFKACAAEEFAAAGLTCGPIDAYATCRRLVLYAQDAPAGPGARALAGIFPRLIARLQFPDAMTWEPSRFPFARPIRGLVALHGEKLVTFSLAGLKSGRVTDGHDAAGPRRLKVPAAERYFRTLEHACVLVKDGQRLEALRSGLAAAGKRMKLQVEPDADLLRESLYLAEYPVVVVGGFSQEFLALPPEVLRSALKAALFFPVADSAGRPQPYFAGVRDGVSKGQRNVEEGFRAAAEAALAAARRRAGKS
ncbi:MAG: glycine--tRNA ligase subunit beta [Elusimicrobiales bacterium]|nr:glycine--tRNA ligase subunit beta [Elusimicrobiales bacterium]